MDDNDVTDRLRSVGARPVPEEVKADHLRRIAVVPVADAASRQRRFGPVAVAAACVAGFFVGSTGLAMAGALPDQAQSVAHDVFGVVQVEVPAGKEGKRGPCVSAAAKIDDEDAKQAAKDACPKGGDDDADDDADEPDPDAPGNSGNPPGQNKDATAGRGNGAAKHDDDPCKGRPAWAGPMTKEERAAAKAENDRTNCPDDGDADDDADEADDDADDE